MKKILDEYTDDHKLSPKVKGKVMQSARFLILAKDLGELFTSGLSETSQEILKKSKKK